MPKFIITHGSIIQARPVGTDGKPLPGGKQKALSVGDSIECSAEERAHMDPSGMQLVTPEVFAEMRKQADAQAAVEAAQLAENTKPKAKGLPAKTLKALAALSKDEKPVAPKGGGK
jgi:hypothetical protein